MKKVIFSLLFTLTISLVQAQSKSINSPDYQNALGVKIWNGGGISFKHFFTDKDAGELFGYFWNQGFRVTGLYEIHGPISGASGLKWYIGPGAHVGFYNVKNGNGSFVGVDGVLGLDYKFNSAPINISLDWQPSFEFGEGRGFYGNWGGLGVRYTF